MGFYRVVSLTEMFQKLTRKICQTRLISIVSKPIIVVGVVVVIDVVFVKKKLGPSKTFWSKKEFKFKII